MEQQLKSNQQWYNRSKGIIREVIEPFTEEWFTRRKEGIGGSEIGNLLGMNDYEGGSCLQLFHQKIGIHPEFREGNKYTFFGKILEQTVADVWEYYDGTENGYIKNSEEKNVQRQCRNVNGFIVNMKYPHLYVNIDRLIQKGSFNLLTGELLEDNGILECKTMSSFVAKKWEAGLPPIYTMQAVQQCICMELDYAEIAVLELDNRNLSVYPIQPSSSHKELIIEHSYNFWYNMVLPAKRLVAEMNFLIQEGKIKEAEKVKAQIDLLEPSADNSESYKQFMNERWLSEPKVVKADFDMIENVKRLVTIKDFIKSVQPEQTYCENLIREYMREHDEMDCEGFGKVTWKTGKDGKTRTMRTAGFKHDSSEEAQILFEQFKNSLP